MSNRLLFSFANAFGQVLFLFGFLGWLYGIYIQFYETELLKGQISHLTPWLRVDIFAISCFILSAIGFFIWRFNAGLNKD